tara:strand:- start:238 stop:681 length:444 start_codon:yes stop_codon:yes gene_type:complete
MVFTEEERKERKRIRDKKYRENNKEKQKEYFKKYNAENKDLRTAQKAKWARNNKEKIKEINHKYNDNNPHILFKSNWKNRGLIWDNEEEFMNIWKRYCDTTNCDLCNVELNDELNHNTKKCMDHEHKHGIYGKFRNILCWNCNIRRF